MNMAKRKLTFDQAEEIRKLYKKGNITHKELGTMYHIGERTIHYILNNSIYRTRERVYSIKGAIRKKQDVKERFMEMVCKLNECWIWIGSTKNGYGQFTTYKNKNNYAHRMSYVLFKGEIPEGLLVRHKCHNKLCVNPEHLLLGTHQDNMDDDFSNPNVKRWPIVNQKQRDEYMLKYKNGKK